MPSTVKTQRIDLAVSRGALALVVAITLLTSCASGGSESPAATIRGKVNISPEKVTAVCSTSLSSRDYSLPEVAKILADDGSFKWEVPGPGDFLVAVHCGGLSEEVSVHVGEDDVTLEIDLDDN